jgi:Uma2 family endonuclease
MTALPKQRYTLEEYLELDANSEARLEYWDGEVFDMSGVSEQHNEIEVNLIVHLSTQLHSKGCRIFAANVRIKVPSLPPYRYGDTSALCGQAKFEKIGGVDVLTNPQLIIEVLSDSTEAYDRGHKFLHYKSIPSFTEYLLIAQQQLHVSQFVKEADNRWVQHEFNDLSDVVKLASMDCELALRDIYANVNFAPDNNPLS